VKAYKAGKMGAAVSTLTVALSSGGLSSKDLAKALYYRGLAYRRSKKPAEAIADLTSALWLKSGLSTSERQDAIKNRTSAYREAGINEPATSVAVSSGAPASSSVSAASAPTSSWKVATKKSSSSKPVSSPGVVGGPALLQVEPKTSGPSSSSSSSTTGTAASSKTGLSITNPLAGVGSFFSNMFGGGSSASKGAEPGGSTGKKVASTGTDSSALSSPSTGPVSAVSAWSSETQLSKPSAAKKSAAASRVTKPKAILGKYRVRVAALRSREEALKVVTLLEHKYAAALGGRQPEIAPESFGNMGTFYNVQVGPFAKANDYKALCMAARSNGYDCLVLKK